MTSSWMRRCKRKKRKSIVSLEWIQSHLCHSTPKKSRKVIESEDEQEDKEESEAESEHTIRPLKFVDDEAEEVDEVEEEQEDDEDVYEDEGEGVEADNEEEDDAMDVDPPEYVHMNSVFNMKYSNIRLTELNNP